MLCELQGVLLSVLYMGIVYGIRDRERVTVFNALFQKGYKQINQNIAVLETLWPSCSSLQIPKDF